MPKAGDSFITTLKKAHLKWGEHRHTTTRGIVIGEGYLKIPAKIAYDLEITNNSSTARPAKYDFSTADNFVSGKLLASGNQYYSEYAKQFQGSGDLRLLGNWFSHINANIGDRIEVKFITPRQILLTKL